MLSALSVGVIDFSTITRDDPESLIKETLILRSTSCRLARELAVMKILRIQGDPLISENDKSGHLRNIDESATPLFGGGSSGNTQSKPKESLEDYYSRIIEAHRS